MIHFPHQFHLPSDSGAEAQTGVQPDMTYLKYFHFMRCFYTIPLKKAPVGHEF
jgi:hypothetical protein